MLFQARINVGWPDSNYVAVGGPTHDKNVAHQMLVMELDKQYPGDWVYNGQYIPKKQRAGYVLARIDTIFTDDELERHSLLCEALNELIDLRNTMRPILKEKHLLVLTDAIDIMSDIYNHE